MLRMFLLSSLTSLFLFVAGCGGSDTDCKQGEVCACAGAEVCVWNCVGSGCNFTTSGQGAVNLSCESGGCSLTDSGQGAISFSCAGGNCTAATTGQGSINLSCAGGGCSTTCGGQTECNTTECPACTCTESALTASCNVM